MTDPQTTLELARHDAQALHKKISGSIARAEQATWAEVKVMQADVSALGARMQTMAQDQAEAVRTGIAAAVAKITAAATLVEDKATDARDGASHANAAMLDSLHSAANSPSTAVASARSTLAHAIAPKQAL